MLVGKVEADVELDTEAKDEDPPTQEEGTSARRFASNFSSVTTTFKSDLTWVALIFPRKQ